MSQATLRHLTRKQVDRYRLDGHFTVEDVLTPDQFAALAARADLIAAGKASHIPETSIQLEKVFQGGDRRVTDPLLSIRKLSRLAIYDEVMWQHVTHPVIVDVVADLLGTDDIKLYGDQLFMKPPELGAEQQWHQDSGLWRDIFPMDLVTAWTAIDEATVENGCLNFAPGTHRWGMLDGERLGWFLDDLGGATWPVVAAPLCPGSVSFHHSLLLHQSNANTSRRRRRGYAVHYMRASSRRDESVTDAPKMQAFRQVRGRSFPGRV